MGVDYSASFGLGFIVEPSEVSHLLDEDCLNGDETIEDLDDMEIIECLKLPVGIEASYWGNSYTGNHTYYIRANSGITTKEGLIKAWDQLESFIEASELGGKTIGIIGGGLLW